MNRRVFYGIFSTLTYTNCNHPMRLMILVLCLYIILMPRSLCVCVHLGVTFTLIFIINYY